MIAIFNIIGILLILFVIYWFWFGKVQAVAIETQKPVIIKVDEGMYDPSVIEVKVGQKVTLTFIREDETPCSEVVLFSDFNESLELPINTPTSITLMPDKKGEYQFTCQMGMYRGKLKVV